MAIGQVTYEITDDVQFATQIVIVAFLLVVFLTIKKSSHTDVFPISVTNELKGLGILTVVFAHFTYMKVNNWEFLYPLSTIAGVGVDLFLLMSGFGLTVGMMKRPMGTLEFYKKRVIKIFIPFWIALIIMFIADFIFLDKNYGFMYMIKSALGFFPTADGFADVNSPFWYITWMMMFYILFPLFFIKKAPWLTAIILAVIALIIGGTNPLDLGSNWLHRLHSEAFSIGIVMAWLLAIKPNEKNKLVESIKNFRDNSNLPRYLVILVMALIVAYVSQHTSAKDWPTVKAILGENYLVEQLACVVIMMAFVVIFVLKKVESKFLAIYGAFSYEVYLIHWPLMGRYDVFFDYLPSWAAVIVWMVVFILVSMLLQKLVTPVSNFVDKITK
jgi:peptidoglycan/LPS O-acetylase OafA/YrhL